MLVVMSKGHELTANDLVTIAEVIEAGSLAEAARRSGQTRASLSLRIKNLERRSGIQLFRRNTQAVVPTGAGMSLGERGRSIRQIMAGATEESADRTGDLKGQVHVCLPTGFGTQVAKSWIFDFSSLHPNVVVRLTMENGVDNLVERNIDVSLRVASSPAPDVIATRVMDIRYGLYGSRTAVANTGVPTLPADIERLPMLVSDFVGRRRQVLARNGQEEVTVGVNPRLITSNFLLIKDAILSGLGWGFLPEYLAGGRRSGQLVSALDQWQFDAYGSSLFVIRLAERHQSAVAKALATYLIERAVEYARA